MYMGVDMALEIRSVMVALDPLTVQTSTEIVLLGSRNCARNSLNVTRRGDKRGCFDRCVAHPMLTLSDAVRVRGTGC